MKGTTALLATVFLALVLLSKGGASAQNSVDVSGHWVGTFFYEGNALDLEFSFRGNGREFTGRGIERNERSILTTRPYVWLSTIVTGSVQGRQVRFAKYYDGFARIAGHGGDFNGAFSANGQEITGQWRGQGRSGAFSLRRVGDRPHFRSSAMPRTNAVLAAIESSTLNSALPLFSELYWAHQPLEIAAVQPGGRLEDDLRNMRPGVLSLYVDERLRVNLPRIEAHARVACSVLTDAQRSFLRTYAQRRFSTLLENLRARRASLEEAFDVEIGLDGATLIFRGQCGDGAEARPAAREIAYSDDLILAALLGSMFVDNQFFVIPPRALTNLGAVATSPSTTDNRNQADFYRLLFTLRASPLYEYTLMARRDLKDMEDVQMRIFEGATFWADCPRNDIECWWMGSITRTAMSAFKVEVLFQDQVDFVLAHELGHIILQHSGCSAQFELDADRFAIALMRPDGGLFLFEPDFGAPTVGDTRFASGVDLFMTAHSIAGIPDAEAGNRCYPTFQQRLESARSFERSIFQQR